MMREFPAEEKFDLLSQAGRAANSIALKTAALRTRLSISRRVRAVLAQELVLHWGSQLWEHSTLLVHAVVHMVRISHRHIYIELRE